MPYVFGLGIVTLLALCGTVLWGAIRTIAGVPLRRVAVESLFVGYLLALTAVVVIPFGRVGGSGGQDLPPPINLVPFATIVSLVRGLPAQVARQLGGNVVIFVPFGLLLPVLFERLRRPLALVATALAVSLGIEVVQLALRLVSLSRRSLDVDDVMLNVTGALIGYGIWWAASRLAGADGVDGRR